MHVFDQARYLHQSYYQPLSEVSQGNANTNMDKYRNEGLINGLQIASQLARNSEQYFQTLNKVFTPKKLVFILQHALPIIRAKGCNLVGNLCR